MTFAALLTAYDWKPIAGCPGRLRLVGRSSSTPAVFVGGGVRVDVHRVAGARDLVHVAVLEGGGLISYERADGTFVHTLNTDEGFRRKLEALGIALP